MKKLYDKIFSIKLFAKIRELPVIGTFLSYEMLSYLFFGVSTTIVNFVVFFLVDKLLGNASITEFDAFGNVFKITFEDVSTLIAWVVAVLFAYVTNKLWVFESKSREARVVIREIISFFAARIMSFVLFESLGFMLVRNILNNTDYTTENFSKWAAKLLMAVAVVIFNYVMSKLVIFKKKAEK